MKPTTEQLYLYQSRFEGVVDHMYLDIKALVTVGVGNLIDPVSRAEILPFRYRSTAAIAPAATIRREWQCVKWSGTALKGAAACLPITELYLPTEDIRCLVEERSFEMETQLQRAYFPDWDAWPADAQLATLGLTWAVGVTGLGKFPKYIKACCKQDWKTAANECRIDETGNPGVIPRNIANRNLFLSLTKEAA